MTARDFAQLKNRKTGTYASLMTRNEFARSYLIKFKLTHYHRVSAMAQIAQNDIMGAKANYESAISLAHDRAPLRVWYGGFLSRHLYDQHSAEDQLKEAERLAPSSALVKLELARILQYQRKFDEARERLDAVSQIEQATARTRRVHLDLSLQNETRNADYLIGKELFTNGLECLESARKVFDAAPPSLVDSRTIRNLNRIRRHTKTLRRAFQGLAEFNRLLVFEAWLHLIESGTGNDRTDPREVEAATADITQLSTAVLEQTPPSRGRLSQLHENYGFIAVGTARYFFHRGSWRGHTDFRSLGEGTIVEVETGVSNKGSAAVNVRPIVEEQEVPVSAHGQVSTLLSSYGFIRLDNNLVVFFHQSACVEPLVFSELHVGDQINCVLEIDPRGRQKASKVKLS